jgi:hypothetical protein
MRRRAEKLQRMVRGRSGHGASAALLVAGLAFAGPMCERAAAAPYALEVMLAGAAAKSAVISGYAGTPFTLEVDDETQAMYAISSAERRDNPCTLWIGTESVNDPARSTGRFENRCGDTPGSRTMKAAFRDDMDFGPRVFVTGIRVCTNNKETRVKGFQLRGKAIGEDGRLSALAYPPGPVTFRLAGGSWDLSERDEHVNDSKNPADYRNNCKEWHAWAECPEPNQVATGLIGHFEAGKEPRSLTGVRLLCESIVQSRVGAVRRD